MHKREVNLTNYRQTLRRLHQPLAAQLLSFWSCFRILFKFIHVELHLMPF